MAGAGPHLRCTELLVDPGRTGTMARLARKLELENIGNHAQAEGFCIHLFETGSLLQIV